MTWSLRPLATEKSKSRRRLYQLTLFDMDKRALWDLLKEVIKDHDGASLDDPYDNWMLLVDLFVRICRLLDIK